MRTLRLIDNERGVALITVLLVALVVGAFSVAAALIGTNSSLINRYQERQNVLEAVADAGLEIGRSLVNGDAALYPDSGYATLQDNVAVTDASGAVLAGVTRSIYVGPTGITTGQYGVFGSVVSEARDAFGNRVVRRGERVQQSFARFAYFTTFEPSSIQFGGGDQIWGPVHSNSPIRIYSPPPTPAASFWGPVTTAQDVQNAGAALFAQGYQESVDPIPMPSTTDLNALAVQAQAGNTYIMGGLGGPVGTATTRVEFVALDLNGDGLQSGADEGFIRVYQVGASSDAGWVAADVPPDYGTNRLQNSRNCGHYHPGGAFVVADDHPASGPDSWIAAVSNVGRRCYLGGSDSLSGGFVANDGRGQWLPWPGAVSPVLTGRPDAGYLFPITRALNPNFKGVIFVEGKVLLSGVLRGRVTVAATGDIIVGDDVTYATNPGSGNCNDILGLFSGGSVVVSDNTINAPVRGGNGANWFTYDDTPDEFLHAVVLALSVFTVENYAAGATAAEPCQGQAWGRGCLFLNGGVIQFQRGAVGTLAGTGNLKRYSYNQCGLTDPPPYFPTTGVFDRGRYYEVNPAGFDVAALFQLLTP
jgi:hypothetical protein